MSANAFLTDKKGNQGMVGTTVMLVVLLAVLYIGLDILDGIEGSTALESGDTFYNSSIALTASAEGAYDMAGLLPTVLIATAILGALLGIMYRFG